LASEKKKKDFFSENLNLTGQIDPIGENIHVALLTVSRQGVIWDPQEFRKCTFPRKNIVKFS
jgi:hypothetical protein